MLTITNHAIDLRFDAIQFRKSAATVSQFAVITDDTVILRRRRRRRRGRRSLLHNVRFVIVSLMVTVAHHHTKTEANRQLAEPRPHFTRRLIRVFETTLEICTASVLSLRFSETIFFMNINCFKLGIMPTNLTY